MQSGSILAVLHVTETYQIDTPPGSTTSFVSRGSNKWPAGAEVTARTISGHRDMSTTSCPGDLVYSLLNQAIPADVTARRISLAPAAATSTTPATAAESATSEPPSSAGSSEPSGTSPVATAAGESAPSLGHEAADAAPVIANTKGPDTNTGPGWPLVVTGSALGAVAAAASVVRRLWQRGETPR